MKKLTKLKILIYSFVLMAMTFAFVEYSNVSVVKAAGCCTYGEECTGRVKGGPRDSCCYPGIMQAPCSQAKPNYCRATC